MTEITWELSRAEGKVGTGNWQAFPKQLLPDLFAAVSEWKRGLDGIERPWLCWCVDDDWCVVQQRLAQAVGWTPVVGTDGAVARPRLIPGAVFVDFNRRLQLPLMWMPFVQDFVHLMCARMAFWHSDVLPPMDVMRRIAGDFEAAPDGAIVVSRVRPGILQPLRRLRKGRPPFYRCYGNYATCTTAGASRSLWEHGCGWWRNPQFHPNARPEIVRADPHWEHGVGIWLWEKYFGGPVIKLGINMTRYHYSTHHPLYRRHKNEKRQLEGSKHRELASSFDLGAIVEGLGLPKE